MSIDFVLSSLYCVYGCMNVCVCVMSGAQQYAYVVNVQMISKRAHVHSIMMLIVPFRNTLIVHALSQTNFEVLQKQRDSLHKLDLYHNYA